VGFGLFCGGLFACWRGVVVGGCIVLVFWWGWWG